MRNWLILFLCFLVMAGSLIPCCPADNCQDEMTSTQTSHPEEGQGAGTCSPFFSCGTCVGFDHQIRMVALPSLHELLPQHSARPVYSISDTYLSGFFQPPRIS